MLLLEPPLGYPDCGHCHVVRLIFNALTEGRRLFPKFSQYTAPVILSLIQTVVLSHVQKKTLPSMMLPPPSFTVGMLFLGWYSSIFFLQTQQDGIKIKKVYFTCTVIFRFFIYLFFDSVSHDGHAPKVKMSPPSMIYLQWDIILQQLFAYVGSRATVCERLISMTLNVIHFQK